MGAFVTAALCASLFICVVQCQWRRKLASERFFYSGIDGAVESGWSDGNSIGVRRQYNRDEGGAEGVARLTFDGGRSSQWSLEQPLSSDDQFVADPSDQLIIRVKSADQQTTDFILSAETSDGSLAVDELISIGPYWSKRRMAITTPSGKPVRLRKTQRGSRNSNRYDKLIKRDRCWEEDEEQYLQLRPNDGGVDVGDKIINGGSGGDADSDNSFKVTVGIVIVVQLLLAYWSTVVYWSSGITTLPN